MEQLTFEAKLAFAAITDEFSPDLRTALTAMKEIGMTGAELRSIHGKNILDLSNDELKSARDTVAELGFKVPSISSPLLKCVFPGGPDVDERFARDVFGSKHTFGDQPRLTEHAFEVAKFFGAPIVRVFSYWRTVKPELCLQAVVKALGDLAALGEREGIIIGLENEHACNIATGSEVSQLLDFLPNPALQVVWDPANALVAGEDPFPGGYSLIPKSRIAHVHAKDCHMVGHQPVWGPLGTRTLRWKEQIAALLADGYAGWVSLETHWTGPGEDKLEGSRICGWNLRGLLAQ
jgi:sugar phosphate isomerase/epimerase